MTKTSIAGLTGAITLITSVVGVFVFLDDRHAHAEDIKAVEQKTTSALVQFERRQVINQLNQLSVKSQFGGGLTQYDKILKEQLELELKTIGEAK